MPTRRKPKKDDASITEVQSEQVVETPSKAEPEQVAEPPSAAQLEQAAEATSEPHRDKDAVPVAEPAAEGFEALGLVPGLLQAVREQGFEEPTPIQRRTIPLLLEGRDVVAQAQTGTGKTAAFALPLLQRLDLSDRSAQALVLAPTRELAIQVAGATYSLGRHLGVQVLPIYGGQPIERQLRALRGGIHVIIGTPGRVLDHLRRGSLSVENVRILVLDEADEMLDMGFEEELDAILSDLPEARQTGLFSATIPPRILRLAGNSLKDPVRVTIEPEHLTVPQVQQTYYEVAPRAKLDALTRILDMETPGAGIIFCRTKRTVDEVGDALISRGYPADMLHGDLSQAMRDRVMYRFREGQTELLIATDVAARGLDIGQVSHVINFDIPEDPEQYVHRIGRTARAGRSGDAITLVAPREMRLLHEIERLIRRRLSAARVPSAGDIAQRRMELTKDAIMQSIEAGGLETYLLAVEDLASDGDVAQVAAAALRLAFEHDGSASRTTVSALAGETTQGVESGMQRLFIDIGRKQGVRPGDIVGAITNEAGIPGAAIGAIDLYDNFAFVEVAQDMVARVIEALQSATLHGKGFTIDIARPREELGGDAGGEQLEHHDRGRSRRANRHRPEPGEAVAVADEAEDEELEEDDIEPPRRPPNWRDDVRPPSPRYGSAGAGRGQGQRPGAGGRGREGFGPFRGPEPREGSGWQQRRRGQGDRRGFGSRPGDSRQGEPFRPQRPEGGNYSAPGRRGGERGFGGPRPHDQGGFRGPRDSEGRRPQRPDSAGQNEGGQRPAGGPQGPRPRRGRDEE